MFYDNTSPLEISSSLVPICTVKIPREAQRVSTQTPPTSCLGILKMSEKQIHGSSWDCINGVAPAQLSLAVRSGFVLVSWDLGCPRRGWRPCSVQAKDQEHQEASVSRLPGPPVWCFPTAAPTSAMFSQQVKEFSFLPSPTLTLKSPSKKPFIFLKVLIIMLQGP